MNSVPAKLYTLQDEPGLMVTVAGRGDSGHGRSGPTGNDQQMRGGTNKIDGANDRHLWWRFDAPGDSSGNVTKLEGISGPGDSGGPALIQLEGETHVVGVSSAQSTRATGGREGLYGVTEYYVRVSSYVDWLTAIMKAHD